MAKEGMIEVEGAVHEVLLNTQFRVRLLNGAEVLARRGFGYEPNPLVIA